MPTAEHEGTIELFCNRSDLLDLCGPRLPRPRNEAEHNWMWMSERSELTMVSPAELRADALFIGRAPGEDKPGLVVVFEVQRDRKEDKRRSWAMYVAAAAYRYRCPALLVVVCPDEAVARWARKAFKTNAHDAILEPLVLGPSEVPLICEAAQAQKDPELAVLSAMMHGSRADVRDELFSALVAAVQCLPEDQARTYTNTVYTTISPESREALKEAFMPLTDDKPSIFKDIFEEGEARGEARMILVVLAARGIDVPDSARRRIEGCSDTDVLERWGRLAVRIDRVGELFDEPTSA